MPTIQKTDEEWRAQLSEEQYRVTRQKGTEPAFTGKYWNTTEDGVYRCIGCGEELFTSEEKFDSGCGWPSFYASSNPGAIDNITDKSWGMIRTEIVCKNCGAHLGHVFDDGPKPTGLRYCVNSASIQLDKPSGKPE